MPPITKDLKQIYTLSRDKLHNLLKVNGLLLVKKRAYVRMTDSRHGLKTYHNRVKDIKPTAVNQLWVSDLSYVRAGVGFAYVSVILDAYSRKIVGCRAAGAIGE